MALIPITVQVLNGATGEIRELIAHVPAKDEQEAVNKLFASARRDDYYYRFLGEDGAIAPISCEATSFTYQNQEFWERG